MPRTAQRPGTAVSGHNGTMDEAVRTYIDGIDPANRPLFDRLHGLILSAYPDADLVLSYRMPTYKVGRRRLCGSRGRQSRQPLLFLFLSVAIFRLA